MGALAEILLYIEVRPVMYHPYISLQVLVSGCCGDQSMMLQKLAIVMRSQRDDIEQKPLNVLYLKTLN